MYSAVNDASVGSLRWLALAELLGYARWREALPVEVERQPEEREQRGRVEEERQLGDSAI